MKTLLTVWALLLCTIASAQTTNNESKTIPGTSAGHGKTVRYDLYVKDTIVNYSGKNKQAIAINGTIPGPTMYFTEGDTAEIYIHNTLKTETSIHWHGLLLPNRYDGVPYLTNMPTQPGETHLFKFPIIQNGTYWYHSHTKLQEQSGMYGAIIIHKREPVEMKEYTMVLSDWTDMKPKEVERFLHNENDWFAIKKGTTQSYAEAARAGHFKTKLTNEWKRMTAMDVSDVYYEKFLINGKPVNEQPQFKAGEKVRLRVINGSSSTYFWLNYGGGKITVIANDGEDVQPVEVDRLIVGVSETYDVVVTIPKDMSYEFLATAEDRTQSASLWLGSGMKMPAPHLPKLKYFAGMSMMNGMMKMNGDMKGMEGMTMSNQTMDMNNIMFPEITGEDNSGTKKKATPTKKMDDMPGMDMSKSSGAPAKKMDDMPGMDMGNTSSDIVTLNYGMLKATKVTTLPNWPMRTLNFELTGNMNRYVWTINNKAVSETDKVLIRKGENIRIVLYNNTMMRHPMHLHGHFFRLLNGQGEYSPRKTVLDIMPMERDTIEFAASESGDWFFHCHILYHMMSGMGRVFSYENSPANPELPNPEKAYQMLKADDRTLHPSARIGLESNGSDGEIVVANTRYRLSTEWRVGLNKEDGYETESHFGRYIGKMQWLFPYVGWDIRKRTEKNTGKSVEPGDNVFGQGNTKNFRQVFHLGLQYTLPLLIVADASLDHKGNVRLQLLREDIPVSKRLRFNFMVNTDREYMAGFRYIMTKYFSLSTHYDSDMGYGAGITLTY
jgi:CopA family copper-resistance protein